MATAAAKSVINSVRPPLILARLVTRAELLLALRAVILLRPAVTTAPVSAISDKPVIPAQPTPVPD